MQDGPVGFQVGQFLGFGIGNPESAVFLVVEDVGEAGGPLGVECRAPRFGGQGIGVNALGLALVGEFSPLLDCLILFKMLHLSKNQNFVQAAQASMPMS